MTQKLRPPVQSVPRVHVRPLRHLGVWWFVAPLLTIAICGVSCGMPKIYDRDELAGIAETADGGIVIGVTSEYERSSFSFRGLVIKTEQDGLILWRRVLDPLPGNELAVKGVAESRGGEILVAVQVEAFFSWTQNASEAGFYLYKLNHNGDSIWERKLDLGILGILGYSSGGVIVTTGSGLALTDEEANVLWESDGAADVVAETKDGDIVAVGGRDGRIVARRLDSRGTVLWDRELADIPGHSLLGVSSIVESPEEELLILVGGGLSINMEGDRETLTESKVLMVIDRDGELIEIREHEAFEQATSVIVIDNTDILIISKIGLIRLDQGGIEVWRNEASSVRAASGSSRGTILVGTLNGDILVAKTVSGHNQDASVTRVSSSGEILFSRRFDGEGNGGFIDE